MISLIAFAVVGVPWSRLLLGGLPSRGALVAAPIGFFLAHYLAWLGLFSGVMANGQGYAWIVLGVFALLSAGLAWLLRHDLRRWRQWFRPWAFGLVALLAIYVLGVALRWLNPEIQATEKPMEFALLNAVIRSPTYPPYDPWFAGEPINYYYLGYSMAALLTQLSGVAAPVAFNLYLATLLAMTALAVAAAAYDLTCLIGATRLRAVQAAVVSTLLAVIAGNLAILRAVFGGEFRARSGFWDGIGWNASRVIQREADGGLSDFTINEFPSFSFILGDLHPHVMALPFAVLVVSFALQWLLSWSRPAGPEGRHAWARSVLTGVFLGGLYGLNAWDFPSAIVVVLGAALFAQLLPRGRRRWGALAAHGALLFGVAIVAWLPFHLNFSPFSNSLGIVTVRSEFTDFVLVFGLLGLLAAGAVWALLWDDGVRGKLVLAAAALIAAALVVMNRGDAIGVLLVAVVLAPYLGVRRRADVGLLGLAWLLALAAGLLVIVELVHVRDFFGGAYLRMNTVFKVYYQVWGLLAVAAGPAFVVTLARLARGRGAGWSLARAGFLSVVAALALVALAYPVVATRAKAQASPSGGSLDGLAHARASAPDDFAAAQWLARHVSPDGRVLEAPGRAYSDDSRMAVWTGLPTVIGWDQHEALWRRADSRIEQRKLDVNRVYIGASVAESLATLRRYQVSHVVFGAIERERYGSAPLERLRAFLTLTFRSGETYVFMVPPAV